MMGCSMFYLLFFQAWGPLLLLGDQWLGLAFRSQRAPTVGRVPDALDNGFFKSQKAAQSCIICMGCSLSNTRQHFHFYQPGDAVLITAEVTGADSSCNPFSPAQKGKKTKPNPQPHVGKESQPPCRCGMWTLTQAPGVLPRLAAVTCRR